MNRLLAFLAACCVMRTGVHAEDTSDQFYNAIRSNDLAALRALLKSGGDVNSRDKKGSTPLMFAAAAGSTQAMGVLLEAGADVNAKNGLDVPPLLWCAGDPEKVRMLVKRGADVNVTSKMMRTPLMLAAQRNGASAVVKFLLDSGADVKPRTKEGMDALVFASNGDDLESMRLIMAKAGDAIATGPSLAMSLMNAAANGNTEAVKLLLSKGADVNLVSPPQTGPGVKNGPIALGNFTALILAVSVGKPDIVRMLLDAGANVNAKDVRGMTPLMLAIASDRHNPEIIRMLIDKGADPNIKSAAGETCADWAEKMRVPAIYTSLKMEPKQATAVSLNETPVDVAEAVRKSIGLLQRTGNTFFKEGGCVSCHAQNLTAMAVQTARSRGIAVDEKIAAEQLKSAELQSISLEQPLLQGADPGGAQDQISYAAMGLAAGGHAPDRITDTFVYALLAWQRAEGHWHTGGVTRPPMEDGDFGRTALSMRALQLYGTPALKDDIDRRIARAKNWLLNSNPVTTEDHSMQLMGAAWAGVEPKTLDRMVQQLIRLQRPDGGWAQTTHLASDAYATGQALYALHEAGVPAGDRAYQRGVQFLLKTQLDDGSWHVRSRSAKFQPYFQSGFPHDHDQWISSAATAWAAMALTYEMPPKAGKSLTAQR